MPGLPCLNLMAQRSIRCSAESYLISALRGPEDYPLDLAAPERLLFAELPGRAIVIPRKDLTGFYLPASIHEAKGEGPAWTCSSRFHLPAPDLSGLLKDTSNSVDRPCGVGREPPGAECQQRRTWTDRFEESSTLKGLALSFASRFHRLHHEAGR